jgi:hypothetical protein
MLYLGHGIRELEEVFLGQQSQCGKTGFLGRWLIGVELAAGKGGHGRDI